VTSTFEDFWRHRSFAVVGHAEKKRFPFLTFRGLRNMGKTALPVDPSADEIEGERAYANLASLPHPVDAAVIEVPREETRDRVADAAAAGIRHVWIHMGSETPEALELGRELGLDVRSGHCAVMYLNHGFNYHALHRWASKLAGNY
jgi:predicted CoA-binding protein